MKKAPTNTTEETSRDPGKFLAEGILFGGSNAIERQEARGQQELVNSDTLPTDGSNDPVWAKIGVKFGDKVEGDDIFRYVELPAGWKKARTDHSMHSHLVDDKERIRGRIFYKAAFYDRSASIHPTRRFEVSYEPKGGFGNSDLDAPCFAIVKDGGKESWRSPEPVTANGPHPRTQTVPDWNKYKGASEMARTAAAAWLNEHFPKWEDLTAYWD